MKQPWLRGLCLALVLLLGLSAGAATAALAQSDAPLIQWWDMGSGGGQASAGEVTLRDTLGQPLAGPATSADGQVTLSTGYWQDLTLTVPVTASYPLYLPFIRR